MEFLHQMCFRQENLLTLDTALYFYLGNRIIFIGKALVLS